MQRFLTLTTLIIATALATTACHKTFLSEDGAHGVRTPKLEAPASPLDKTAGEEKAAVTDANILTVDCVYDTSSNVKLQIVLDLKKKSVVGAGAYDIAKGETAASKYQDSEKQITKDKVQLVDLKDGTSLAMTTTLFKKGEKADVLLEQDVYHCN
jgi:hypothetical protein